MYPMQMIFLFVNNSSTAYMWCSLALVIFFFVSHVYQTHHEVLKYHRRQCSDLSPQFWSILSRRWYPEVLHLAPISLAIIKSRTFRSTGLACLYFTLTWHCSEHHQWTWTWYPRSRALHFTSGSLLVWCYL